MTQSRTHTCGELRLANAGETVTLVGWMENIREVGNNFAFLVLRDFYGTTQVVIENEEMMNIVKPLNKESTISVTGIVRERTSKNPKLPTGDIEIAPTEITVLGRCRYNELPFEINHSREADESQRLKYRYLDLRNPEVKANIILRCNVVSALRTAMTEHGFLEITTPILTASSPEGARDYLVPARKHPGKFYALPQAPQQFKQLLMTAGFDRFFQITLPLLKGVIRTCVTFWSINATTFFLWTKMFSPINTETATIVPVVYLYDTVFGGKGVVERDAGAGAAVGVVLTLIIIAVYVITNLILKDSDLEY